MKKVKVSGKVKILFFVCVLIFLLPLAFHQHFKSYLINILNGGFAILPATFMVIWQVQAEYNAQRAEDKKEHDDEIRRIERNHNDEVKKLIYELLACMNDFPEIFGIKYRIGVIEGKNGDYTRIVALKNDLIEFKREFHQKSIRLQSRLIYLSDNRKQQKNLSSIIKQMGRTEQYIQRLINILNERNLRGGLGYTERDYEEVIINMCKLKDILHKLPENISLNDEFMDMNTKILDYYRYVISCSKQYLTHIYNEQNKLSVQILKEKLNPEIVAKLVEMGTEEKFNKDEAFRDCLKIWALNNDIPNTRDYEYTNNHKIEIIKGEKQTISRFVPF